MSGINEKIPVPIVWKEFLDLFYRLSFSLRNEKTNVEYWETNKSGKDKKDFWDYLMTKRLIRTMQNFTKYRILKWTLGC